MDIPTLFNKEDDISESASYVRDSDYLSQKPNNLYDTDTAREDARKQSNITNDLDGNTLNGADWTMTSSDDGEKDVLDGNNRNETINIISFEKVCIEPNEDFSGELPTSSHKHDSNVYTNHTITNSNGLSVCDSIDENDANSDSKVFSLPQQHQTIDKKVMSTSNHLEPDIQNKIVNENDSSLGDEIRNNSLRDLDVSKTRNSQTIDTIIENISTLPYLEKYDDDDNDSLENNVINSLSTGHEGQMLGDPTKESKRHTLDNVSNDATTDVLAITKQSIPDMFDPQNDASNVSGTTSTTLTSLGTSVPTAGLTILNSAQTDKVSKVDEECVVSSCLIDATTKGTGICEAMKIEINPVSSESPKILPEFFDDKADEKLNSKEFNNNSDFVVSKDVALDLGQTSVNIRIDVRNEESSENLPLASLSSKTPKKSNTSVMLPLDTATVSPSTFNLQESKYTLTGTIEGKSATIENSSLENPTDKSNNIFSNFWSLAANPSVVFASSTPTSVLSQTNDKTKENKKNGIFAAIFSGSLHKTTKEINNIPEEEKNKQANGEVDSDDSFSKYDDTQDSIVDSLSDFDAETTSKKPQDTVPNVVKYQNEFDIKGPLLSVWMDEDIDENDDDDSEYYGDANELESDDSGDRIFLQEGVANQPNQQHDPSHPEHKLRRNRKDISYLRNTYGVMHVRILRAQRLSCPVNSEVHAVVSLPPWKGKVRSNTTKAFAGPHLNVSTAGESVANSIEKLDEYPNLIEENSEKIPNRALNSVRAGVCAFWDEDISPPISMINDASDDDGSIPTIPSIQIELAFCPLGLSFVELNMCKLKISCLPLLKRPLTIKRQWFVVPPTSGNDRSTSEEARRNQLLTSSASDTAKVNELDYKLTTVDTSKVKFTENNDDSSSYNNQGFPTESALSRQVFRWPAVEIEAMFEPLAISDDKSVMELADSIGFGDSAQLNYSGDQFDTTVINRIWKANGKNVAVLRSDLLPLDQLDQDDDDDCSLDKSVLADRRSLTPMSPQRGIKLQNSSTSRMTVGRGDKIGGFDVSMSVLSISRNDQPRKEHLLRNITFWTPAICCVCKRNIMASLWQQKAYHCEECNVDCCSDCRLQVDIRLPCGSESCTLAVANAIQSKLTVDNILNVVAPVVGAMDLDETTSDVGNHGMKSQDPTISFDRRDENRNFNNGFVTTNPLATDTSLSTAGVPIEERASSPRIGSMKMTFVRAFVLKDTMPAETEANEIIGTRSDEQLNSTVAESSPFRPGDYYLRVTWTGSEKSSRTRTVQSAGGRPKFRTSEMRFDVKHYGTVFRIEIIDAATDKAIGSSVVTTQAILQRQRDFLIEEKRKPFLYFLRQGPLKFDKVLRTVLELRSGLTENDFFNPSKQQQQISTTATPQESKSRPGDVVGCLELLIGFEEDLESLYGNQPYLCPPRPGDEFNVAMFQMHIARVLSLIDDMKSGIESLLYLTSWNDPVLSTISLYFYIRLVWVFDPIHIGSFPIFLVILWMIYLAVARSFGHLKLTYVQKEIERNHKTQNVTVEYSIHRPIGRLRASIVKGKNFRSPELGLPGNVRCRMYWDPTRYMISSVKETLLQYDKAARATHEVANTNYVYSINPEWEQIDAVHAMKRLRQLIPSEGTFFDSSLGEGQRVVEFPILQPFRRLGNEKFRLEPWERSGAAIVVEIKFNDVLSVVPGSEYSVGEVAIPVADIIQEGKISRWFDVVSPGTGGYMSVYTNDKAMDENGPHSSNGQEHFEKPQVFLQFWWVAPVRSEDADNLVTEREASIVIQEELVKSAILSTQQKLNIVGTSIDAFNTMRGLSSNLLLAQNTLGTILDIVEHLEQSFFFTDPFKSTILLASLVVIWVVLALVPMQAILLVVGLVPYCTSFYNRFLNRANDIDKNQSNEETTATPRLLTYAINAFRGLPTSEDLRKTYFWESRREGLKERSRLLAEKRQHRMDRLWHVQWYGDIDILTFSKSGPNQVERNHAFAMLQGNRFLWWRSLSDFDDGVDMLGYVCLRGHSGLATPSPMEVRHLNADDLQRLVCVFGRGKDKQERLTLTTDSTRAKQQLEQLIEAEMANKHD